MDKETKTKLRNMIWDLRKNPYSEVFINACYDDGIY
jgi:hypothetical protein